MPTSSLLRRAAVFAAIFVGLFSGRVAAAETLKGAGSTFVAPLMAQWIEAYQKVNPQVTIAYDAVGSGLGISQYSDGAVDFGATDAPLSKAELEKLPQPTLQLPLIAGAVVLAYNIPGVGKGVRLSGESLAEIFLGKITKWNDPRLLKENPDTALPDVQIVVIHRSDGSGTTSLFTKYLSAISPEWKTQVGASKLVNWPTGRGGGGNPGVAALVKKLPGAIGYMELAYAEKYKLAYGPLKNRENNYVMPSVQSVAAAVKAAMKAMEKDNQASLLNGPGINSYPISGLTYALLPKNIGASTKVRELAAFLQWAMGPGQKMAEPLLYAPLPRSTLDTNLKALSQSQVSRQ